MATTPSWSTLRDRYGTRLTLTPAGFRRVGPRLVGMILSRGWAKMLAGSLAREVGQQGP